jgi:hypothetical protein
VSTPRIGVLGPLQVRDGTGAPITVGGPRPRALLGAMMRLTDRPATGIEPPDYEALLAARSQDTWKRDSCSGVSTSSGTARSPHSTSSRPGLPAR